MPLQFRIVMLRITDDLTRTIRATQKPAAAASILYGICEEPALFVPVGIDPPVTVPESLGILAPPDCKTGASTALFIHVASGALPVPLPISTTWLDFELKSVCARDISLLARS